MLTHLLRTHGHMLFVAHRERREMTNGGGTAGGGEDLNAVGIYLAGGGAGAIGKEPSRISTLHMNWLDRMTYTCARGHAMMSLPLVFEHMCCSQAGA